MTTFVLVHGICHGAWCWDRTRTDLVALGHDVVAVDLALTSLADDAAIVVAALDRIEGGSVLVGHSYGGHVISAAAGGRSDMSHLVYVAAIMIDGSEIFAARATSFPRTLLGERMQLSADGVITIDPQSAIECFYHECTGADARHAADRLRPTSIACLTVPSGANPWERVPSTYVVCERDRAIDPAMQRAMSASATKVVTLDTDHSPFMSRPAAFLDLLLAAT